MSTPLRLGVVGAGSIALRCHFQHLVMDDVKDRVQIAAVCDPVLERAEAAAAKWDVPFASATMEEMMEANVVDAVSICSPIGFHFEQGMLAVENGVHLHFNKSMTTTVEEANTLIAAANAKGVKVVSSPGEMIRPRHQKIKQMIEDGAIGRLTWAVTGAAFGTYHENESSVRSGDDPLTNVNPAWYFRKPGGGPLYDMTVYGLHAMTGILGPAKRVTAFSGVRIHEREFRGEMLPTDMDDNTLMVLDFGDNLFSFVYGTPAGGLPNMGRPMIFGQNGVINGSMLNGERFDYEGRELDEEFGMNGSLPHVVGNHRGVGEEHVYEDIMQLVDYVLDDKPTLATPEHARHVVEIFDAAYRSAEAGKAMELTTAF
ncbi:MAG: Gfo/Idh/MocA family oxidoreductase [Chloroflexota bacterium]